MSAKQIIQQGYTLIELMIVVAIIGILAAIAISAYQDYIARSQMSEPITLTEGLKGLVLDAYSQIGTLNGINSNSYGIPSPASFTGKYTSKVEVTDGVITATLIASGISSGITSATLILTPSVNGGSMSWHCSSSASAKYLPKACLP